MRGRRDAVGERTERRASTARAARAVASLVRHGERLRHVVNLLRKYHDKNRKSKPRTPRNSTCTVTIALQLSSSRFPSREVCRRNVSHLLMSECSCWKVESIELYSLTVMITVALALGERMTAFFDRTSMDRRPLGSPVGTCVGPLGWIFHSFPTVPALFFGKCSYEQTV